MAERVCADPTPRHPPAIPKTVSRGGGAAAEKRFPEVGRNLGAESGGGRSQDLPEVPEQVTVEFATQVLQEFNRPDCTTRDNVRPPSQLSVKAMCLGAIKPYFSAITASKRTRMWPKLTKMATQLIASAGGDKANYNFSVRMHVDKNNHGPSYIIGLGDYAEGDLWIYDPTAICS